jgi:hypothetical protein
MAKGFDYAYGDRVLVRLPLAASSADIEVGDAIRLKAATNYYQDVDTVSDATVGIAVEKVTSPTADGGATVLVNVSEQAYYRVNVGNGTLASTMQLKSCDIAASGDAIDVAASTTDNVLIHDVDLDDNSCIVSLIMATYGGVV